MERSERQAGRHGVVAATVLFLVTTWLYHQVTVPELYNVSDPLLIVPTSLSLLHDGDLDLSELGDAVDPAFHGMLFVNGRPYNRYPIGTSLLILPVVWVADRLLPPDPTPMARALVIAAHTAKFLAALSVALLFLVLVELTADTGLALALALVFAFATLQLPIHAGGLFTHNAVIPLLLAGLLILLRHEDTRAAIAALPFAAAFVTRPTSAPLIVVVSLWVARHRPRVWPRYVALGGGLGVLFVAWSYRTYGTPLPPYYWSYDVTSPYVMSARRFAAGLAGHLLSPNRGLLVFMPIFVFSLWGMAQTWHSRAPQAALYRALALAVVVHWVMISVLARKWWAGWSFGPRHLAEMVPVLVVLLVPAIDGARTASRRARALLAPLALVALAWSLFVAVHGATSLAPSAWNATPVNVDEHPERVWDWHDLQALRGTGLQ